MSNFGKLCGNFKLYWIVKVKPAVMFFSAGYQKRVNRLPVGIFGSRARVKLEENYTHG